MADGLPRRSILSASAAGVVATAGCLGTLGGSGNNGSSGGGGYRSYGYDATNRGYDPDATGLTDAVAVNWRFDGTGFPFTPAVTDDSVYVFAGPRGEASEPELVSLSRSNGGVQWRYSLGPGWSARGTPAVSDGTVYAATGKSRRGRLHAVDTDSGNRAWSKSLPGNASESNPVVADSAVVVGAGVPDLFRYRGLFALETDDGSVRWSVADDGVGPTYPAVADGQVYYVGMTDGEVPVESASLADGTGKRITVAEDPFFGTAIADGTLYLQGTAPGIAVDADSGETDWTATVGGFDVRPPAVGSDSVFYPTESGIAALDRDDGTVRWRHEVDGLTSQALTPTVAGDTVYVNQFDGRLYALNRSDGSVRWRISDEGRTFSPPAVVDDAVYVCGPAGMVALEPA